MSRRFETGATRDKEDCKLDFEGALSPAVLVAFTAYMNDHRFIDGEMRSADNWQKGIPLDSYMKSLLRHVMDLWLLHRGLEAVRPETGVPVTVASALGGVLFNAQGYWHEVLRRERDASLDGS